MRGASKRILITGATDGIGLALARKYAKAGGRVLVTGRKPLARSNELFPEGDVTYIRADQADPIAAGMRVVQAMDTLGWHGCDIAILNAGIGWTGDPVEEPASSIDEQIAVNLNGTVQMSRAIAEKLFAANGQLIIIGSVAHSGAAKFATYAATKAALRGFVRALREEWRGRVRVQMLHPGPTRTGMHAKAGLKVGAASVLFTSVNRAANSIMTAIEAGIPERKIDRSYAFRKGWRVPKPVRRWSVE